MSLASRLETWNIRRAADEAERAIAAELNGPVPKNDAALFAPVRVKVLRSFLLEGEPVPVGAKVTVPAYVARDLVALGRAELIS